LRANLERDAVSRRPGEIGRREGGSKRSDIAVLTQGVRNANDGLSTLQIIDGGINNISKLLDRARTLATQSASGTFTAKATFTQRTATIASQLTDAAYVAFCGTCDVLNARPFDNGIATNVGGSKAGSPLTANGWHRAAAKGLPKRFITSIVSDPDNARTVYVTLACYSRRWLPVGAVGEPGAAVGKCNVFKSTDAGENFTNISGNLPDGPAESVLVYKGKLIVGTDTGVYTGSTSGGKYQLLGKGLPNVPVFSMALKPKSSSNAPDVLYVATHGRSVYTLPLG
jgi:hypothetical protein